MDNEQGWRRLARLVKERRDQLGLVQVDLVTRGGPSLDRIQSIEAARTDRYSSRTIAKLERVLEWEAGSVREILDGGDPKPLARSTEGEHAPDLGQSSGSTSSNVAASGLIDPSTQQNIDATNRDLEEIQARVKNMTPAQARALLQLIREARMGAEPDSKSDRAS